MAIATQHKCWKFLRSCTLEDGLAGSALPKIPATQNVQQLSPGWREEPPHVTSFRTRPPGLTLLDVPKFDQGQHRLRMCRWSEAAWVKGDGAEGFKSASANGWG